MERLRTGFLTLVLLYPLAFRSQAQSSIDDYLRSLPYRNDLGFYTSGLVCTDTASVPDKGFVQQRYYVSGKMGQETVFRNRGRDEIVGIARRWFPSGQLQSEQLFVDKEREGALKTYYPNGKLRRVEMYRAGKLLQSECFRPDGTSIPCSAYQVAPEYPGGLLALMSQIQQRITYPKKALHDQWEGTVFVSFVIGADGLMRDAKIVKGVQPELNAEALQVINSLDGWHPGKLDDEPTDFQFTIPVKFVIQ